MRLQQHIEVVGDEPDLVVRARLLVRAVGDRENSVVGVARREPLGHPVLVSGNAQAAAVGQRDAFRERPLLGEIEEHAADLATPEAQVGIHSGGLELVELGEDGLRDYDLGTGEREQHAGIGEQHVGIEDVDLHSAPLAAVSSSVGG